MSKLNKSGIAGIERDIKVKQQETNRNITESFRDLSKLMEQAKEMNSLAKNINQRLKDKGAAETDDTILLKSHLLSLGLLDDPVSRQNYANQSKYFLDLGRQVDKLIAPIAEEKGGQMSLTEAYCTVNRARGFELISPDDLLSACATLEKQKLRLRMVKYESGLIVLQCNNYSQHEMNEQISQIVQVSSTDSDGSHGTGLSAQQLAVQLGVPLSLARQRLLDCEKVGLICRDESIQGFYFYPNLFIAKSVTS